MTSDDRVHRPLHGKVDILHEKVDRLSGHQAGLVEQFVDAILTPLHSDSLPETWLATATWREAFAARLQGYHALNPEPLGRLEFEAAFNQACEVAGWQVEPATSATQRFYDTTISYGEQATKRLSLKATAASRMQTDKVDISKLTEAAWIQDARIQASRRNHIVQLFQEYQAAASAIFILRGFKDVGDFDVFYDLIEIPTSLFEQIANLTVQQAQAATINIPPGATSRNRQFAIGVDRSDSKIKLAGVRIDVCVVHGRWGLRKPIT